MGGFQRFRGNPENKLLYVVDQLIGGINTDFSDDVSPDNEFKSIVNFSMDKRGSLYKRKGFGKLNAVSQIFNLFEEIPETIGKTEDNKNPEKTNDNIVYMKLIKNDNGCFRNLSEFSGDKAYRDYQRVYGFQNNSWELLMITTSNYTKKSKAWLFKCKLKPLNYSEDGQELEEDTIEISSNVFELPVLFNWDNNLKNIDTIEFFDKIYFTSNDKGLVCFDRTKETFTYSGTGISGQENQAYKPNAMEIRKVGFNLLGDDPLHWVDFQGLSTDSIQGIYLTTKDNKPLQIIPSGGKFRINVLYTGENKNFTITLKEGEKDLKVTSKVNSGLTSTGLKVYDITISNVPTSQVEIKITMDDSTIDPYYDYYDVGQVDPETKKVETLNIGDCGMVEMYNRAVYYKDDTIWFSEINNFNYIPNYNYILLPIEPTDKITKIIYFRNVYIVFTKSRIYKMLGSFGDSDFQLMPLNLSIGCHAPNTVIPVENVLYFASPRGLYQLISSASYTTSSATFENVKEIDTKVKQLTSDITLYLSEKADPTVRYDGISEHAAAIRYKDKYMLFYNNFNSNYDDIEGLKDLDVLVYQYELKAFSEIKFPIKPTFLFMVDGAVETFCTVAEKEEYTKEEVLLSYDFEQENEGKIIKDLTGNGNDAIMYGGSILSPGIGIGLTGDTNTYAKAGILNSSINFKKGFSVSVDCDVRELNGCKLFSLAQSNQTSANSPEKFSIYTSWSNGYRGELICNTVPNATNMTSKVNWTLRWHRDSMSRNSSQSGSFNLKIKNGKTLISTKNFNFNMGNKLYADVLNGSFTVKHNSDGNYTSTWVLSVSSKYPTYSTGWKKGSDVYFDQRQGSSFDNSIGIRISGVARAYDGGCNIYFTPYLSLNSDASLYIGSRDMYTWVDGVQHNHRVGAVSTSGGGQFSGGEQSQSKNYTGSPTINIDARYNIRATINGIYRENVDISGFNVRLPSVEKYQVTNWNNFSTSGSKSISFKKLLKPSYREIYAMFNENGTIIVSCSSEYARKELKTGVVDNIVGLHNFTFNFTPNGDNFDVDIFIDDNNIDTLVFPNNTVVSGNRDNNILGYKLIGTLHKFTISDLKNEDFIYYDFSDGNGSILTDKSGNNRNGSLFGEFNWLNEKGLLFDGKSGYLSLPNFDRDVYFTNGFSIEFEAKFNDISRACKIFDFATSYDTGDASNNKASINAGLSGNLDKLEFKSTSVDYKSYKVSVNNADLLERNLWKFTINDNGSGYDVIAYKNNEEISRSSFEYGGITNIMRRSNFIGKSNNIKDKFFDGMLYNFKIIINASVNPVPIYAGAIYEYDTTYDDFGKPMEIKIESKGINLQYPLHVKKLKNIYVKGLGGYKYNNFFFELYSDGHLVNDPRTFNCYVDELSRQVVYDYTGDKILEFNEMTSLLGNLRLNNTKLGNTSYETKKLIIPSKGKNFNIKIYGESSDYLSIESFGFVFKLGKVKED